MRHLPRNGNALAIGASSRDIGGMALSREFVRHLGDGHSAAFQAGEPEAVLRTILAAAQAAWPEVSLSDAVFMQRLATAVRDNDDVLEALGAVHAADLYLATACAAGDSNALSVLESRFFGPLSAELRRKDMFVAEDVLQHVRVRLLVGEEGRLPRIAGYHGRGPLSGWLAVTAARVAVDIQRGERRFESIDEVAERIASIAVDPELGYLKARYGREMELALLAALQTLSTRDASVLRLHTVDGMTAESVGRMYQVTRRTVHRWLEDIHTRLLAETQRLVAERLHVSPEELQSLLALVRSQIHVSLHGTERK